MSNLKGIDVQVETTNHAHMLAAAGVAAVGFYLRSDRASLAMIQGLHAVQTPDGIPVRVFSIWERGEPVSSAYFSAEQGTSDAERAVAFAATVEMPQGKPIFFCVDFDPSKAEIEGPILEYFKAVHAVCSAAGYLVGCYGSGACCAFLVDNGWGHFGYLSQSTGFDGYEAYKEEAAIRQGPEMNLCGFDVDQDTIIDEAVLW